MLGLLVWCVQKIPKSACRQHSKYDAAFNYHVYENSNISNIDTLIPAVSTLANPSIHYLFIRLDHIEKMFLQSGKSMGNKM
jgi:hypothetical protein